MSMLIDLSKADPVLRAMSLCRSPLIIRTTQDSRLFKAQSTFNEFWTPIKKSILFNPTTARTSTEVLLNVGGLYKIEYQVEGHPHTIVFGVKKLEDFKTQVELCHPFAPLDIVVHHRHLAGQVEYWPTPLCVDLPPDYWVKWVFDVPSLSTVNMDTLGEVYQMSSEQLLKTIQSYIGLSGRYKLLLSEKDERPPHESHL